MCITCTDQITVNSVVSADAPVPRARICANLHEQKMLSTPNYSAIFAIVGVLIDIMYIIGHIARAAGIAMDGSPSSIRFRLCAQLEQNDEQDSLAA